MSSAIAECFDLASGTLGGIGGDALEDRDPFLEAGDLPGQALVLVAEQQYLALTVDIAVPPAPAAARFWLEAMLCADPVVRNPGNRSY
ncbi:hypothetical protein [Sphingomonas sp. PAMC26645]|uniref:hypothetical protein n=1 Tax=Sphingomonas sp. PAMC26645 TaxID=2565555 RepID=UPI001B347753